jgi:hypothetical protein
MNPHKRKKIARLEALLSKKESQKLAVVEEVKPQPKIEMPAPVVEKKQEVIVEEVKVSEEPVVVPTVSSEESVSTPVQPVAVSGKKKKNS